MKTLYVIASLLAIPALASAGPVRAAASQTAKKITSSQIKYDIIKQMNKKYQLGGASQNSQSVTLSKSGKFHDYVFEGPGSDAYNINGKVNLKTGKVTQSRETVQQ